MIGRFSQLGVYHELVHSRYFYRVAFAGALALASDLWERGGGAPSTLGNALAPALAAANVGIAMGAIGHNVGSAIVVISSASLAFVFE